MTSVAERLMTDSKVDDLSATSWSTDSLLERVRAGDQRAWQRLVQFYGPLVYAWCRRWGLQDQDVADVFQDVFQAVAERIEAFRNDRPEHTFRGWLWTITRNKLGDHLRRLIRQPTAVGGEAARRRLDELAAADPRDDSASSGSSSCNPLNRILAVMQGEFEQRTWRAFMETTAQGRKPADVAAELGMSIDAVYKAKSRVLCRLRQELRGLGEPEA